MNKSIQTLLSPAFHDTVGPCNYWTYLNYQQLCSNSVATGFAGFAGFAELPRHLWWSTDTPWVVRTPRLRCGPHFEPSHSACRQKIQEEILGTHTKYKNIQEQSRTPLAHGNPKPEFFVSCFLFPTLDITATYTNQIKSTSFVLTVTYRLQS